ncbi:hypothetical protein [Roseibium alexandrii]|uniref:Uncharacterized protein n=1 Tax=Roseibium alexandrii (strain DSM 17067 / NCIMB 14079 / DFL-11) TaxID=244592 RepID=A0A5E8GSI7_ROSAD|nr:hypothetical protein [Roseibium alexandrii]EEE42842.1 hypothetical protein SADFL11_PLAS14 [Roseibium alexandrii DFL-11]
MNHKFLPTITLDLATLEAIKSGELEIRPGQWCEMPLTRRKGQFISVRDGIAYFSWTDQKQSFEDRTQRFCRAIWHQRRKAAGPVTAVQKAPASLQFDTVRDWFKNFDTFNELSA